MIYKNGTKVSVRNTPNVTDGDVGIVTGYSEHDHLLLVEFSGKTVCCGAENCTELPDMTKEEKIINTSEYVKSTSTKHALDRVLKAVQLYMPPDGISEREAMGMIIEAVDPMPNDFDAEAKIKEVMELVEAYEETSYEYEKCYSTESERDVARKAIESKLRELIQ